MEIRCDECGTRLNVPEERLAGAGPHKVACPKCGCRLTVSAESGAGREDPVMPGGAAQAREKEATGASRYGAWHDLEGKRLALILEREPDQRAPMERAVEELGCARVNAEGVRDAIGKLRSHTFDLILLSDRFEDEPWDESPILNYLNSLPIGVRRRMFVALVGNDLKTRDPMAAFSLSANLVIGREHSGDMTRLLRQGIEENEAFYGRLMHALAQLGKT